MQELYDMMRKCFGLFKDYAEATSTFRKMEEEKPVDNTQFLQYSKRLADLQNKRTQSAHKTKNTVRSYMEMLSNDLERLIKDVDSEQKLIENPNELLEFIPQLEGEKKINGKSIKESVHIVYSYASAFSYKLEFGGELAGSLEFDSEDDIRQDVEPADESAIKKEEPQKENLEDTDTSILDELDDIL